MLQPWNILYNLFERAYRVLICLNISLSSLWAPANVKPKYLTESTYDIRMLLMCKYGKDNVNNLGVNAKQNDFLALKFKSAMIL